MASQNTAPRLSAPVLTELMVSSLPASAEPHLRTPWDAVALLCHACMLAVDFRLVGLGEDHKMEATSEASDTKPLPTVWNENKSDFAFRYRHPQSSLEFLVKVGRLGGKAVVNGLGLGDDKVKTFDVAVKDYLSESQFPFSKATNDDDAQSARDLTNLFISAGRVADFASLFKINIIQSLTPNLHKEGYTESAEGTSQGTRDPANRRQERDEREDGRRQPPMHDPLPPAAQPHPFQDPLAAGPRRPMPAGEFLPPGFEDEHEILRPAGRMPFGNPGMPTSGERDLYPPGLGPHDPLRIGPMGGGRRTGGGGMYPAADDPMFGGGGGEGVWDDRAPPGARYDPIGPGDGPPNLRGGPRFPGGPGGGFGGGGPPNPFGGFGGNDFI